MKIVENLIEVNEPVVKAYLYERGVIEFTDWGLSPIDIVSKLTIIFEPFQVKPLLKPKEGEWAIYINLYNNYTKIIRFNGYMPIGDASTVAFNTFTLQAEKDGILREMVELCNPGSTPEVTPEVKALIAKHKGDPT